MTEQYVELHARSAFSFLEGASVPEELIAAALELEMPAMALLDRDGVYGSPRFQLGRRSPWSKVQSPKTKVQRRFRSHSSFVIVPAIRTFAG